MYKITLITLEGGKNLRTETVEGITNELPKINERFFMISSALEKGKNIRTISTSPVKSFGYSDEKNTKIFKTNKGSEYKITYKEIKEVNYGHIFKNIANNSRTYC